MRTRGPLTRGDHHGSQSDTRVASPRQGENGVRVGFPRLSADSRHRAGKPTPTPFSLQVDAKAGEDGGLRVPAGDVARLVAQSGADPHDGAGHDRPGGPVHAEVELTA